MEKRRRLWILYLRLWSEARPHPDGDSAWVKDLDGDFNEVGAEAGRFDR